MAALGIVFLSLMVFCCLLWVVTYFIDKFVVFYLEEYRVPKIMIELLHIIKSKKTFDTFEEANEYLVRAEGYSYLTKYSVVFSQIRIQPHKNKWIITHRLKPPVLAKLKKDLGISEFPDDAI